MLALGSTLKSRTMRGTDAEYREWAKRRVGTTIQGTYRVDDLIGLGGMAAVFAGTAADGRRVALKVLHPDLNMRADLRTRFHREAMAANAVRHPGAVEIIADGFTDDGVAFIAMELLDGQVIEYLWQGQGKRLPAPLVLGIAREVCEVLIEAHRAGIVHRDIKPENLLLTNDGRVKVLDFGLARFRAAAMPSDTHTGMIFGTPAFMPPEQAAGQTSHIDERTDLWALGATMFTLLSGEVVHEGESLQHIVMLAASLPARPLSEVLPDAHPLLASLIDRSLTWDKDMRWPDAAAMRDAICSTCLTIFGEARPELIGADELTLNARKPPREDDDTTGRDQTFVALEPPVSDDLTERRRAAVGPAGGDATEATYVDDDRTDANLRTDDLPPDSQGATSVMSIEVRPSARIELRSDLRSLADDDEGELRTRSMPVNAPRAPTPTMKIPPSKIVVLPWILAGVATVVALIAVYIAVTGRHAH